MEFSSLQMVSLYYDPNGEKVFSSSMSNSKEVNSQTQIKADLAANKTPYNIEDLKTRIKELESELRKKQSMVNCFFLQSHGSNVT